MQKLLTKNEFQTLIHLARKVLWSDPEQRRQIQKHGINIVPANFYSNIPMIDEVHASFEYRDEGAEVYNSGIFDKTKIAEFVGKLSVYADEFSPPMEGNAKNPDGYFWKNPAFSYSDAMAYYCVLRHYKPQHVLEIGSGFSTFVADEALAKNGSGKLTLIEPYPKGFLRSLESVDTIIESFVQDIPLTELVQLVESSDVWFIDSTHTVKVGSDCLYIYLKIMPEIAKNIVVHSHDIFLPFGTPKSSVLEKHIYWTEQYLLYAYMLDNPKVEVLFGSAYAHRLLPDLLRRFMGGKYPGGGGSLWFDLNGSSTARDGHRADSSEVRFEESAE